MEAENRAVDLLSELKYSFIALISVVFVLCLLQLTETQNSSVAQGISLKRRHCCQWKFPCSNKCVKSNQLCEQDQEQDYYLQPVTLTSVRIKTEWKVYMNSARTQPRVPRFTQWECVLYFQLIMCCGEAWSDTAYVICQGGMCHAYF